MFNANILATDLADSGLDAVGSYVYETYSCPEPEMFTFVPASEEWLSLATDRAAATNAYQSSGCYCCCCTGECRDYDYDDMGDYATAEEFETAGFYLEREMDVVVNAWHQARFWVDGSGEG